ncbi:MAG: sulfite exporter TauE/SafE family protein, partial [Candidatus Thorarchaeota archaeon]
RIRIGHIKTQINPSYKYLSIILILFYTFITVLVSDSIFRKLIIKFYISPFMNANLIMILISFGVLFGIIGTIAGIGGGALHMSLMVLLLAIPINEARDTSSFIIVLFTGIAFINYFRQGKINIKLTLIFAGFAILGGISATILFILIPIDNTVLKIIIASVVLTSGINMIRKAIISTRVERSNNITQEIFSFENFEHKTNLPKAIPLFFVAGFVAYLSGIGGGMLFVPILTIVFEIPIHFSTALSTSMIFFIGIYNAGVRMVIGEIHYLIGLLIAIGAIIGSLFGAKLSNKIHKHNLQFIVALVLIGLAIRMYFII